MRRMAETLSVKRSLSPDQPIMGPAPDDDVIPATISEVSSDILTSRHDDATLGLSQNHKSIKVEMPRKHSENSKTKANLEVHLSRDDVTSCSHADLDLIVSQTQRPVCETDAADDRPLGRGGTRAPRNSPNLEDKVSHADSAGIRHNHHQETKGNIRNSHQETTINVVNCHYETTANNENSGRQTTVNTGNVPQVLSGNLGRLQQESTGNVSTGSVHPQARGDFIPSDHGDRVHICQHPGQRIGRKRPGQRSKLPVRNLRLHIDPKHLSPDLLDLHLNPPNSEPNVTADPNFKTESGKHKLHEKCGVSLLKSIHEGHQDHLGGKCNHDEDNKATVNPGDVKSPRDIFPECNNRISQENSSQTTQCSLRIKSNMYEKNVTQLNTDLDHIVDNFSHNLSDAVNRIACSEVYKLRINLAQSLRKYPGCDNQTHPGSSPPNTSYVNVRSNSVQVSLDSEETLDQSMTSQSLTSVWEDVASSGDQQIQNGNRLNNVVIFSDESDCDTPSSVKDVQKRRKTKHGGRSSGDMHSFHDELTKNIHVAVRDLATNRNSRIPVFTRTVKVEKPVEPTQHKYNSELDGVDEHYPENTSDQNEISKTVQQDSNVDKAWCDNANTHRKSPQKSVDDYCKSNTNSQTSMKSSGSQNHSKSHHKYYLEEDNLEKKCHEQTNLVQISHEGSGLEKSCDKQKNVGKSCNEKNDIEKSCHQNIALEKNIHRKSHSESVSMSPIRQNALPKVGASARCKALQMRDVSLRQYRRAIHLLQHATYPEPALRQPRLQTTSACDLHNILSLSDWHASEVTDLNLDNLSTPNTEEIDDLCRASIDSCVAHSNLCQDDVTNPCHENMTYPCSDNMTYLCHDNMTYLCHDNMTYPCHDNMTYPCHDNLTYPCHDNMTYPCHDNMTYPCHDNMTYLCNEHHQGMTQKDDEPVRCQDLTTDDRTSVTLSQDNIISAAHSLLKTASYTVKDRSDECARRRALLPVVSDDDERCLPKISNGMTHGVKTKTVSAQLHGKSRQILEPQKCAETATERNIDRVQCKIFESNKKSPCLGNMAPTVSDTDYKNNFSWQNRTSTSPLRNEIYMKNRTASSPQRNEIKNKNRTASSPQRNEIKNKNRTASSPQRKEIKNKNKTASYPQINDTNNKNRTVSSSQRNDIKNKNRIASSPQRNEIKNKNRTVSSSPQIIEIKNKNRTVSSPQRSEIKNKNLAKKLTPYYPVNRLGTKKASSFPHLEHGANYVSPYRSPFRTPLQSPNSPYSNQSFKAKHFQNKISPAPKCVKLPRLTSKRTPQNTTTNHSETKPSKLVTGCTPVDKQASRWDDASPTREKSLLFLNWLLANQEEQLSIGQQNGEQINPAETDRANNQSPSDEQRTARKTQSYTVEPCPTQCLQPMDHCGSRDLPRLASRPWREEGLTMYPPRVAAKGHYYPSKNVVCVTVKPLNCHIRSDNLELQLRVLCNSQQSDDVRGQSATKLRPQRRQPVPPPRPH